MNDYILTIETIQNYINNIISINDMERLFYKHFVDSDYEFTIKQAKILNDTHIAIEMYFCEYNLKKNFDKEENFKKQLEEYLELLNI